MSPMKKIAILILLGLFSLAVPGRSEEVRYVIDGDTFILKSNQRVRMIGIDTPEISHGRYGGEDEHFGREAKDYLAALIEKKDVRLEDGDESFDRYGRRLAYVYLADGTFVNRKMIEEGYGETFRQFPFRFKNEFLQLESEARAAKRGLWAAEKERSLLDQIWMLVSGEGSRKHE